MKPAHLRLVHSVEEPLEVWKQRRLNEIMSMPPAPCQYPEAARWMAMKAIARTGKPYRAFNWRRLCFETRYFNEGGYEGPLP